MFVAILKNLGLFANLNLPQTAVSLPEGGGMGVGGAQGWIHTFNVIYNFKEMKCSFKDVLQGLDIIRGIKTERCPCGF